MSTTPPTPRRTRPSWGPVVIALAAGSAVLLSGLLVNGCRISTLLSSPNSAAGAEEGIIIVVPSVVRDSAIAGTDSLRVTNLAVTNGGGWAATTGDDWIRVSPSSGGARATVRLSLDPKHLEPGMHRGSVSLQERENEDARATVSVNFLIQQPILKIDRDKFEYRARSGSSVFRDTISITNEGTGPLVWTATLDRNAGWLTFDNDPSGTAPSALAIRATNAGLSYFGTFRETIIISSPGAKNSPQRIEVSIRRRRGGDDDDDDDDSPTP